MKKFSFRLETLLKHRNNIEERERTRFSGIRGELAAEVDHLRTLQTRQAQTLADLVLLKTGPYDPQDISWHYLYLSRLSRQMEQSSKRIVDLEARLETQRQAMIDATRDAKMIANLKRKKAKEFLVELERNEQKMIDEMIVIRHGAKP